jgi:hypothetical protein
MINCSTLQLTSFKEAETSETKVEIDEHIGFAFIAPSGALGNGHLFLKDDKTGAFIELSIDLSSGRLTGATLVGSPLVNESIRFLSLDKVPQKKGLPVFGNHNFDQNAVMPRIEHIVTLSLIMLQDGFVIECGNSAPDSIVTCGRVQFLFARNILVGLAVVELTIAEMAAFKRSLG